MSATASFRALGTTATLVTSDDHVVQDATGLLRDELAHVDRACSRFRDDSELTRANENAGHRVDVGPLLVEAVAVALRAAEATDGIVTPTVGHALRAAGYDRTFELVRARGSFTVRLPLAHGTDAWRAVELDERAGTLRVPRGVSLDLGATAKALASDRAAAAIARATGAGVLVSLGGDIAVAGPPPEGGWVVRVADDHTAPLDAAGPLVSVVAGGLATSSTTTRSWTTDAGDAHHVIDPRTGRPARTPFRTATVAAATCVDANVAALAALVLGTNAAGWLAARGHHARLVRHDGRVEHTGAWPEEAQAA